VLAPSSHQEKNKMGIQFVLALVGIAANYLQGLKNKGASEVGTAIELADQATLAVLQENAKIKGVTVDWSDPAAVQGFVATLPAFTPIPDPGAGGGITQ
jgi:hypothetical protein